MFKLEIASRIAARAVAATMALFCIWIFIEAISVAYTAASAAYTAHRLKVESTVEWHERQQALVAKIESVVRSSPTRCSNVTNTLDLVHRHEVERQRLWAATFRFAGGSQYQGIEETLPQKITSLDCGVWIINKA